ncbi:cyclin-domain-containing protein [Thozetella sp. PMI_491]|nr:cyclin-domain-containing protein [Thozetella sp. PMI_491]
MATVVGDAFSDSSRFHSVMGGVQHQSHDSHYAHRSASRSRDHDAPARQKSPRHQGAGSAKSASARQPGAQGPATPWTAAAPEARDKAAAEVQQPQSANGGASLFPSPPNSSSPSEASSDTAHAQYGTPTYMSSRDPSSHLAGVAPPSSVASGSSTSSASTATTVIPAPTRSMPSPDSDEQRWNATTDSFATPSADPSPVHAPVSQPKTQQTAIHIRDIAHIQSLARDDMLSPEGPGILNDPPLDKMKYEISAMPIADIIEMVAALLTKITTTNDLQHDALNRNAAHVKQAQAQAKSEEGSEGSPMSSSVLAFHGKNVPAITILSYLSRIHKYCPTTYEVFLSLLVYFDRMTERVNQLVVKSEEAKVRAQTESTTAQRPHAPPKTKADADGDAVMGDDDDDSASSGDEVDSDLADDDDDDDEDVEDAEKTNNSHAQIPRAPPTSNAAVAAATSQATFFVVDSFNIHRLIIAGVTCASKFFSDVFYTNSRYAKVGGLPLAELNHLELQFLLLNDFRLAVPVEDLEAYATMLVEFYAREVIAARPRPAVGMD